MINCEKTKTTSLIPATNKNSKSLTFEMLIDNYVNKKGKTVKVYEYLGFIDSFKMMNSSLKKLVQIRPNFGFEIINEIFPAVLCDNVQLLKPTG